MTSDRRAHDPATHDPPASQDDAAVDGDRLVPPLAPHDEPWVAPYRDDFAVIERILARTPGFTLQPIELPSPDLARALASWLRGQGYAVTTLDLRGPEAWDGLAVALDRSPPVGLRPITVVIADSEPDEPTLRAAFARLNLARDRIARALGQPLLWCGDARMHRWTHRYAPDFASIAGVPYTIPLRRLEDLPAHLRPSAPYWWTGAAGHDLPVSEDREGVQHALRRAEALLSGGDLDGARQVLDAVAPQAIADAPHLFTRLRLLQRAAAGHDAAAREEALRGAIDDAQARKAAHEEASLRVRLAELVGGLPTRQREALDERLRARALYLRCGDLLAALRVAADVVIEHFAAISTDEGETLADQARVIATQTSDPEALALAELILAFLAARMERHAEAEAHLERLLGPPDRPPTLPTGALIPAFPALLVLRARVALARGDLMAAERAARESLRVGDAYDLPLAGLVALGLLVTILAAQARPRAAARLAFAAHELAQRLGLRAQGLHLLLAAAELAAAAGIPDLRRLLVTLILMPALANEDAMVEAWLARERARVRDLGVASAEDRALLELVQRAADADASERPAHLLALRELSRRLEDALQERGITPDPDTWPGSDAPPSRPDAGR